MVNRQDLGRSRRPYHWLPWLILAAVVMALAAWDMTLRYVEASLVERTGQVAAQAAVDIAEKLDLLLAERYGDIQLLQDHPVLRSPDVSAISAYFAEVQDAYPVYAWIGLTDARGRILAATDPARVGHEESGSSWFTAVRTTGQMHVQDAERFEETDGTGAVAFAVPVFGSDHRFLGALRVMVDLHRLEDTFAHTVTTLQAQIGTAVRLEYQFMREDGTVIADRPAREAWDVNLKRLGVASAALVGSAPPGFAEEDHERRHVPVVTGYAQPRWTAANLGLVWGVLVRLDRADILVPIRRFERDLSLAGGVMFAPVLGLLVWFTGRLRSEWSRVQEQYRDLVHSLDAIVWEGDRAHLRVTSISQQVQRLLGSSPEQWVSQAVTWKDAIHPEDFERAIVACAEAAPSGRNYALEYRMRAADGRVLWVKDLVTVVLEQGRPVMLRGVIVDITKQKQAEEAERASRTQLSAIIDSAMDAIVTIDEDHRVVIFNDAAEQIFRCPRAEVLGRPLDRLIPERYRDQHRAGIEAFGRTGETSRAVQRFATVTGLRADGEEFPAEASISKVEAGVQKRYTAILRDISARQRSERRVAAEHMVVRILADASSLQEASPLLLEALGQAFRFEVGALWVVGQSGDALTCLDFWCLPGRNLAEFEAVTRQTSLPAGVGLPGRIWAGGDPAWIPDVAQDANVPRAETAARAGLHGTLGFPILRGGEVLGVVEFFSARVEEPDPDLLSMLAATGTQIGLFHERKRVEARAHVLLQAIEAATEAILLGDAQGVISYANPAAERMFGYGRNELSGRSLGDLYPPNWQDERVAQILTASRDSGWSGEVLGLRKDGTRFPRWLSASPIRNTEGRIQSLLSMSRDLTETKQMEAQAWRLERLATMGQLLGGIAHEIKNPLFIVTGRLQLLEDKLARGEYGAVGDDVQKIEGAVQRMKVVAERFLSLAKPLAPREECCSVSTILQEVLEFLANELMKNRIRLVQETTGVLPSTWSDPQRLHEVFMNLSLNAMQAMAAAHGQGTLTVGTKLVTAMEHAAEPPPPSPPPREGEGKGGGSWIEVRIQDDGPGIAPEHRAKLFEPFFSTKPPGQGTGLGLWVVRSILMALGGRVTFETELGRGTTFIVHLPVNDAPDAG